MVSGDVKVDTTNDAFSNVRISSIICLLCILLSGCGGGIGQRMDQLCREDAGLKVYQKLGEIDGFILEGNRVFCDDSCRGLLMHDGVRYIEKDIDLKQEHYSKIQIPESGRYRIYLSDGDSCLWRPTKDYLQEKWAVGNIAYTANWKDTCIAADKIIDFKSKYVVSTNTNLIFNTDGGRIHEKKLSILQRDGQLLSEYKGYSGYKTPWYGRECPPKRHGLWSIREIYTHEVTVE